MLDKIKKIAPVVVLVGVMMGCSTTALAWINQQHYQNNTGQTAYDLTKIIEGVHDINDAYHVDFPYHEVTQYETADRTIIHWWGGQVPNGGQAGACFDSESGEVLNVLAAFWTDANGTDIGEAGPVVGTNAYPLMSNLYVEVTNTWREYNGEGYPVDPNLIGELRGYVYGTNVRWAVVDEPLAMEELTPALDGDPEITWHSLANFELDPDETKVYSFPVGAQKVAILRFNVEGEGHNAIEFLQWPRRIFNPPAAPSNLQATAMSGSRIDLSWQDNANNEYGFEIGRSGTGGGPYTIVGTTGANVTVYSDTTCSPSTIYYYRVRAKNFHGTSAYSNEASATTMGVASKGRWSAYPGRLIPQNQAVYRELIPAEDLDPAHPRPTGIDWGPNNQVRFFPSWNWGSPRPGDQLCWLYDTAAQRVWWKGVFNRTSRRIFIQLNGCDNNDGWADIYVDGTLEFSYDTYNKISKPILIIGNGLPRGRHTVEIKTRTGGPPHVDDVSIDYIAIPWGWDVQEHYHNNTGQPVYNLTKILPGSWVVTEAIHDKFKQHVVINFGLFTIIHWYDGVVLPCHWTAACFNVLGPTTPPVTCAFWTDSNGRIVAPAGYTPHIRPYLEGAELRFDVHHVAQRWEGEYYPPVEGDGPIADVCDITGEVYYAIVGEELPLEELDPCFVDETTWTLLDDNLDLTEFGDTETYNIGELDPCDVVIIRVEANAEGLDAREMVQLRVEDLKPAIVGDLFEDGCVNFKDLAILAENWLEGCVP